MTHPLLLLPLYNTGLGLVTEGKELPPSELPAWDEALVCTLPAVWKNPVTGALSLQVNIYI